MSPKKRLDVLLVERGLCQTREKAKATIMAGLVKVDGQVVDKAGSPVPDNSEIQVLGPAIPYVSRGGLKLAKAISEFSLSLAGKTVADIGASTGGFTDCALQNGAVAVYAIDVGYGQLDWKLRQDSRVINLERTNIRYFDPAFIKNPVGVVTVDVSFISLEKVLPKIAELLSMGGELIALIKPQFEAGREQVGKKGVVRNPEVHQQVIMKVLVSTAEFGFQLKGMTFSPVKGPEGNIEYLIYLVKAASGMPQTDDSPFVTSEAEIQSLVHQAFQNLK